MGDGIRNTVNNNGRPQICVEMESIRQRLEPPPPYTSTDPANNPSVINQPSMQPNIIIQPPFKDIPVCFSCPSCHKQSITTVQFVNSHKTHMIAGFVCGLTLWCMLCCLAALPYMVPTFKKADHFCSNCNYYLGSYSRL